MDNKAQKGPNLLPNLLIFTLLRKSITPSDHINRAYAIYFWRTSRGWKRRVKVLLKFLLSPFKIIRHIHNTSQKYGRLKDIKLEKGSLQRFLEQFYLAFFYSIEPKDYYIQRFYKKDGRTRAKYYVSKKVIKKGVYKLLIRDGLYRHHTQKKIYSLDNKKEFFEFCTKNNIGTIPIVLEIRSDGTIIDYTNGESKFPEEDLFIKPINDFEGKGTEAWFWTGKDYKNVFGDTLDQSSLIQHIKDLAKNHKQGSILIQPLLLPHQALSSFRKNATPTLRIITYKNQKDRIKIGLGMFRFSLEKDSVVDNASAGGLMATIDMEKGILGPAMYSDPMKSNEPIHKFEEQGIQITGTEIPYWKETIALVKKAHKYFPERLIVGWDVLITDNGPILVEGNGQPGIDYIQRTHGHSIGEYKTGKALAKHAQRAIQTLYSGKLTKNPEDTVEVDLYNGYSIKRWMNWVLFREKVSIKIKIFGQVQRVGYRRWMADRAKSLSIKGWCKNHPDGYLEGVIRGRILDVEDLYRECYRGPARARVDKIEVRKVNEKPKGFTIKR